MECVLGIDVGGTSIKAGAFTPGGDLVRVAQVPTGALVSEAALAMVAEALKGLASEVGATPDDVIAVGLDVPGPVDDAGRVGMLPNISLDPEGLRATLEKAFPQAAQAFVNDANAAALGEMWQGAARGARNFVLIALGTGVGAGVVCSGHLVAGAFGAGGEIGHLTMNPDEPLACGCGRHGCLEQYASAKGLVRLYREHAAALGREPAALAHDTDTVGVFDAYRAGDPAAKEAVSVMCGYLGRAIAQVSCVVDPELTLLGGGVAGAFGLFADELRASFNAWCLAPCAGMRILPAALGNQAAMYGCAYQALLARRG